LDLVKTCSEQKK